MWHFCPIWCDDERRWVRVSACVRIVGSVVNHDATSRDQPFVLCYKSEVASVLLWIICVPETVVVYRKNCSYIMNTQGPSNASRVNKKNSSSFTKVCNPTTPMAPSTHAPNSPMLLGSAYDANALGRSQKPIHQECRVRLVTVCASLSCWRVHACICALCF